MIATPWSAQLSWRLPPRSSRWRWCLPELARRVRKFGRPGFPGKSSTWGLWTVRSQTLADRRTREPDQAPPATARLTHPGSLRKLSPRRSLKPGSRVSRLTGSCSPRESALGDRPASAGYSARQGGKSCRHRRAAGDRIPLNTAQSSSKIPCKSPRLNLRTLRPATS